MNRLTLGRIVFFVMLCLLLQPVYAQDIIVTSNCSLADAITAANSDKATGGCTAGSGADTIQLEGNITLDGILPKIASQITLEGKGHTISGAAHYRIFFVSSGTLTLNHVILIDGVAGSGGAIYNDGALRITNSHLYNNTATRESGGAIYSSGTLHISESAFSDNAAASSGIGGTFGGAIYSTAGELHITNSDFTRNRAAQSGGAIDVDGGEVSVINCMFDSNSAAKFGGGAIDSDGSQINITGSAFKDNTAEFDGGAIRSNGTLNITDSTFLDNSSAFAGGAIDHFGTLSIVGSSFIGNAAASFGGAVYGKSSQITISGSRFRGNTAVSTGGAITVSSRGSAHAQLIIVNSVFDDNSVTGDDPRRDGSGGAIMNLGTSTEIIRSSFTDNSATFVGGAIVNTDELIVSNSTFSGNHAEFGGGGLFIVSDKSTTLTHLTLAHNSANEGGGILVYADESEEAILNLRNSLFDGSIGGDCVGMLSQNVSNLIADGSCTPAISGDPRLGRLLKPGQDRPPYHPLMGSSPAIDAADPEYCIDSDQSGTPRPQGAACDIGAFEYQPD